jgi:ketosteroid isomerase-like protein
MNIRQLTALTIGIAGCAGASPATMGADGAAPAAPTGASPFQQLVAAERAFAARSASRGTRDAFLAYLADDAVLFIPRASPGRPFFESQPSTGQGRLDWAPIYAEVSAAGDLGFTTGPYEARAKPGVDSVTAYGNFVSIWTRDPVTNAWKVALDLGTTNERPPAARRLRAARGATVTPRVEPAVSGGGAGVGDSTVYPMAADDLFSARASSDGTAAAISMAAAPDVRIYREGHEPTGDLSTGVELLSRLGERFAWHPEVSVEAQSGDLGYSYGTYGPATPGAPDIGAYVHIWRRGPTGRWLLALDITNPFPR